MENKTTVIFPGGAFKCSYAAGAAVSLFENHNFTEPDLVFASSGSAATGAYFVSEQYDSIRNIWCNLLSTKKLLNFSRLEKIIDVDYLVYDIFGNQDKLDQEKVKESEIEFYIPTTNFNTGEIKYFNSKEGPNTLDAIKASKAIPFVFGKSEIEDEIYTDSFISSSYQLSVKKAIELGSKKILVIDSLRKGSKLFSFFNKLNLLTKNKVFRENYHSNNDYRENFEAPKDVEYLRISPSRKLKIGFLDNNKERLNDAFNLGYEDVKNSKEIKAFFSQNFKN